MIDLSNFPNLPGIYIMRNHENKVLYIGKAKDLKKRISQYFTSHDTRATIPFLISQIKNIETIVVSNEKEALILENTLIKKFKPKYNILLKDDKTYLNILLTKHKWPQLKLIRVNKSISPSKGDIFGPYTSAYNARAVFDLLKTLFPLRSCSDSELNNRTRPCILYEIKRCLAPCCNLCLPSEYNFLVEKVKIFLKGKDQTIVKDLEREIKKASSLLEFEKAKQYHQTLKQIKELLEKQQVSNVKIASFDVIGIAQEKNHIAIVILTFRENKLTGSKQFYFSLFEELDDFFNTFILQNYTTTYNLPKQILTPISTSASLSLALNEKINKPIKISFPKKGEKKDLLNMANINAMQYLKQRHNKAIKNENLLLDIQTKFELKNIPEKIECIDISNISQTHSVAGIVSFYLGEKNNKDYRLYKIKTEKKGDIAAISHSLERHLLKAKENSNFPDLILIDGGKAQLNAAKDILKKLNILNIDLLSISKEKSLHTKSLTQEKIISIFSKEPIILERTSTILLFFQKVRDEAHRFAINFHIKTRSKDIFTSSLDKIEGIGPKKKKLLLNHFKSVENIKKSSIEEIKKIKGISSKDIENIKKSLFREK